MTASCFAAALVLATAQQLCGEGASLCRATEQRLTAKPLETKGRPPLFYASLRPHPSRQQINVTTQTNASPAQHQRVTPNASPSLNTNQMNPAETWSLALEDFRLDYSPLTRPAPLRGLPAFRWLRGWRLEEERGFFYGSGNRASRIALRYSDIFQARGNPDKGGHGPSIFFQFDVGKVRSSSGRRSSIFR